MIKELWILIKMLFERTDKQREVEMLEMKHFPFKGYRYMMWCARIITRKLQQMSRTSRNHENTHLGQSKQYRYYWQYYLVYLWEWLKGNPIIHPSQSAYYTSPFEMEAYANEDNDAYTPTKESIKKYKIKNRKATYREHRDNWKEYCKSL